MGARSFWLKSLLGMLALSASTAQAYEYDYVVVGAGAGGGPLAARLAEAGYVVLLLEAGPDVANLDKNATEVPALHAAASERPGLSWHYKVEHYTDPVRAARDPKRCSPPHCGAQDVGVFYPRGSTVGGSTAVNAMITVLPHDRDWDRIAELTGDASWYADNMRQYQSRVERNHNKLDNRTGYAAPFAPLYSAGDGHGERRQHEPRSVTMKST